MKKKNLFLAAVSAATLFTLTACGNSVSLDSTENVEVKLNSYYRPEGCLSDDGNSPLTCSVHYEESMLKNFKPGDIYYEAAGSSGIAGHIAIVEGVYWDDNWAQAYIRLIEAPGSNSPVQRTVFTPERFRQGDRLLRLKPEYNLLKRKKVNGQEKMISTIDYAIEFCRNQLGDGYLFKPMQYPCTDASSWYCSELVWAAYYVASDHVIDLNTNSSIADMVVWPKEIRDNRKYLDDISVLYATFIYVNNNRHMVALNGELIGFQDCFGYYDNGRKCICGNHIYRPTC